MGYIWVRSYKGLSFVEKQQNDGSHEQGSHSAKNGASSWAKNTLIPQKSFYQSRKFAKKFGILLKKCFIGNL